MNGASAGQAARPLPLPDEASEGFWAAANEGRLAIQRCRACGRFNHAPTLACQSCGSFDLGYQDVSGRGALHSWTRVEHAPAPGFRDKVPFLVGVIELAEQPHLVMAAELVDVAEADLRLGLPLEVGFERVSPDCMLPVLRPVQEQG